MLDNKIKLGDLIFVKVLIIYNLFFSFGIGALGIAILSDTWDSRVRFVFGMYGIIHCLTTYFVGRHEYERQDEICEVHISQLRPPMPPQNNASSAPVEQKPHTVWLGQATDGGSTLKRFDIKPEEKPTQQFIEWVKQYTERHPRSRVPEREAMAMEEYASHANVWLSCMDRVGVLEREDERPNAARRWKDGVSLANALAIFGYAPESFLPKDGNTVPPPPFGVNGKNA